MPLNPPSIAEATEAIMAANEARNRHIASLDPDLIRECVERAIQLLDFSKFIRYDTNNPVAADEHLSMARNRLLEILGITP